MVVLSMHPAILQDITEGGTCHYLSGKSESIEEGQMVLLVTKRENSSRQPFWSHYQEEYRKEESVLTPERTSLSREYTGDQEYFGVL